MGQARGGLAPLEGPLRQEISVVAEITGAPLNRTFSEAKSHAKNDRRRHKPSRKQNPDPFPEEPNTPMSNTSGGHGDATTGP